MALIITRFSGESPSVQPRLLPDNMAQLAFNCRLDNGALVAIRAPKKVAEAPADTVSIYKHGDEWLTWNEHVNAAPGPVAQDRLYFTRDSGAPQMRVAGVNYPLAVPSPTAALTAALSGTASSSTITSRVYTYTWVTAFGEESQPAPVTDLIDWQDGLTVTLSGFQAVPAGRNITKQRIYRSQGNGTTTSLYFLAERDASTANYVDTAPESALGEPLPSLDWTPPVAGLRGLVAMPNGIMAGFDGRDLYFCEPWIPHAWPVKYSLTTDYPIVALGVQDSTLIVTTKGMPYQVQGTAPENMVMDRIKVNLPCVNRRGLVDTGYAVVYPSHDGLVMVAGGQASLVSQTLISRDEWQRYQPAGAEFLAAQVDGRYVLSYTRLLPSGAPDSGMLFFDLTGEQHFIRRGNLTAEAFHYDLASGSLFYAKDGIIAEFDSPDAVRLPMNWRSKPFVTPSTNFGAIRIEPMAGEMSEEDIAANAAQAQAIAAANAARYASPGTLGGEINARPLNELPVDGDVLTRDSMATRMLTVRVIADGKTVDTVDSFGQAERLTSGYRARVWEIDVSGTLDIAEIRLGTSIADLDT